jgi:hypothetical protein
LAKELGLDRALYSRKEAWVQDCLALDRRTHRLRRQQTGSL